MVPPGAVPTLLYVKFQRKGISHQDPPSSQDRSLPSRSWKILQRCGEDERINLFSESEASETDNGT